MSKRSTTGRAEGTAIKKQTQNSILATKINNGKEEKKRTCLSASVMDRHFAAAKTLCLVVSVSSPNMSSTNLGFARMRCKNMK